jgi:hypothetical protein
MFFTCHFVYKPHIIMATKLTHHGGQIIYVIYIYIYIYYGVNKCPRVHLDDVHESNWTVDNLIYNTTMAKILGIFYPNV